MFLLYWYIWNAAMMYWQLCSRCDYILFIKSLKNHFLTFDCDNETSRKILLDLFYTINKQSRIKDK